MPNTASPKARAFVRRTKSIPSNVALFATQRREAGA